MGYDMAMRVHITLDDDLVAELDLRVGARARSRFISRAVRMALDEERRRAELEAALGSVDAAGHDWDDDPAAWVREQRRDARRSG
jgi:metal-responsive CopG/Arc/MetJ family transcriptional regulator